MVCAAFLKTHVRNLRFYFQKWRINFQAGGQSDARFSAWFLTRSLREVFWLNQTQLLRTQLPEPEVCQQSTYALDKRGYCWLAYIIISLGGNDWFAGPSSAPWKLRELSEKRHFCQLSRVLLISRYISSYMVKKTVNTFKQRRKRKWIDRRNNQQACHL